MRLPSDTIIEPDKLTGCLLKHREEGDKSRFLGLAGYDISAPERLERDIRQQLLVRDAELIGPFDDGIKYLIRGTLAGPNGRRLRVTSIWATVSATGETRLVTLYPHQP